MTSDPFIGKEEIVVQHKVNHLLYENFRIPQSKNWEAYLTFKNDYPPQKAFYLPGLDPCKDHEFMKIKVLNECKDIVKVELQRGDSSMLGPKNDQQVGFLISVMRITQMQFNSKIRRLNGGRMNIGRKNAYSIKEEQMNIQYGEGDYGENMEDFDATLLLKYMKLGETAEFFCQSTGVSHYFCKIQNLIKGKKDWK